MTRIDPKPELSPIQKFGFTREDFTAYLLDTGFLLEGYRVSRWGITSQDFFEFNVTGEKKGSVSLSPGREDW